MAYYQYNEITRELVQISDFPIAPDTNLPVSEVEISKTELLDLYQWDQESLQFIQKNLRIITKKEFIKRLTPDEYSAIKTLTTQNGTADYYWQLFMLDGDIDLDDQDVIDGLALFASLGVLTSNRLVEIAS
jgi:hypothetical protein